MTLCDRQWALDMPTPKIKSVLALRQELVTLVHRSHPRNRPTLVVEHLVSDMRRDPEPGHPRDAGPAKIMEPPTGDPY